MEKLKQFFIDAYLTFLAQLSALYTRREWGNTHIVLDPRHRIKSAAVEIKRRAKQKYWRVFFFRYGTRAMTSLLFTNEKDFKNSYTSLFWIEMLKDTIFLYKSYDYTIHFRSRLIIK